jgi:putative membrane protein
MNAGTGDGRRPAGRGPAGRRAGREPERSGEPGATGARAPDGTGWAGPEPAAPIEPDYRFTLANERTFLSWIRTALGLVAAGVAIHQLIPRFDVEGVRIALALACIGLALLVAGMSYPRWHQVQVAMLRGEPIPRSAVMPVVAGGVVVIAVLAGLLVVRG